MEDDGSGGLLLLAGELIQPKEQEAHCHKADKNQGEPLGNAQHTLGLQIHEEIGVDQGVFDPGSRILVSKFRIAACR